MLGKDRVWVSCVAISILLVVVTPAWSQTEKVLHNFSLSNGDGRGPQGPPVFDAHGNLFGTTYAGGTSPDCSSAGCGTVFELSPNGDGTWTESVIHSFSASQGQIDGKNPEASLVIDNPGNLYGTTVGSTDGDGAVFELSPGTNGTWTETVLHDFNTSGDGVFPEAAVTLDGAGHLYGTTLQGGRFGYYGGTVYEIRLQPSPVETVLNSFGIGRSLRDGTAPNGTVLRLNGGLFGVTEAGGLYSDGTVFQLLPTGVSWYQTTIYEFQGSSRGDGSFPTNGLVSDSEGNLYGTTVTGGTGCSRGCGTVFKLTPQSNGTWAESVIYSFQGGTDGNAPQSNLTFDTAGNLYGTTRAGGFMQGFNGYGTVFKLTPGSGGQWAETILYSFSGGNDGSYPLGGVVLDSAGNLYGTTQNGGTMGEGVVFEVTP